MDGVLDSVQKGLRNDLHSIREVVADCWIITIHMERHLGTRNVTCVPAAGDMKDCVKMVRTRP